MKRILFIIIICSLSIPTYAQKSITAYVFVAEECPVCNYLGKTLKKVSEDYNEKVDFVFVLPQKMSSYKTISLFKKKYGLGIFTVELDHDLTITNRYNASITPEVVIVNEKDEILYRGRINNSYAAPGRMRHGKVTEDLALALQQIVLGKSIPRPWHDPIGCYITK